jgi:hypothetical protein
MSSLKGDITIEEVATRRAARAVDFEAATRILNAMKGSRG